MINNNKQCIRFIITASFLVLFSCNTKFTKSIFKEKTAHQKYEDQLKDAGIDGSILLAKWQNAAKESLEYPSKIDVPYQEKAYISSSDPKAMGYEFVARNGEQLHIRVLPHSLDSARLFMDLFEAAEDSTKDHRGISSAEMDSTFLSYTVRKDGKYILRIQPELLSTISFDLRITAEPSLANPVPEDIKQNIGSFFGVERDAGKRSHEGVDIFANRLSPAVAAADGRISRVGINNLGGKVVFLRVKDGSINLYYAHLDTQTVSSGQLVVAGDTLGLIGNTGNARTTPPHLHFGIYTPNGAIDPLPFIRPGKSSPSKILAITERIGDTVRLTSDVKGVAINTPLIIEAAALNGYRATLPNKSKVVISQNQIDAMSKVLKTITIDESKFVYDQPNTLSAIITEYPRGKNLQVIGSFDEYYLVKDEGSTGWITKIK